MVNLDAACVNIGYSYFPSSPTGPSTVNNVIPNYSGISAELVDFAFDTSHPTIVNETPIEIDSYDYRNNSDIQQSLTVGSTKTTTATLQLTVTQGVQTQVGASFNVLFDGLGGASVNFSLNTSFSTSTQQGQSVSQVWNCTTPILVPPRKGIRLSWSVVSAQYRIPFAGKVRFTGVLSMNVGFPSTFIGELGIPISGPIGQLFMQFPYPGISVPDPNTIEVNVAGISTIVNGIDLKTDAEQYDATNPSTILYRRTAYRFRPTQVS